MNYKNLNQSSKFGSGMFGRATLSVQYTLAQEHISLPNMSPKGPRKSLCEWPRYSVSSAGQFVPISSIICVWEYTIGLLDLESVLYSTPIANLL